MSKNDDKIKVLLAKVEEMKSSLGTKPKVSWLTNAVFKYKDGAYFNLNTVKDPSDLVTALSYLLEKESLTNEAAKRLGVESKSFVWDGFSVSEWEKDFKKRVEVIKWDEKKANLDATQKKLNQLMSEDARTGAELENIEKLLS